MQFNAIYLRQIPVFANLPEGLLKVIHAITVERFFEKGDIIFLEGDPGEGFYYVIEGKVKIIKMTDDGREHIVRIIEPGELFAEVLLFNPRPYVATAIAAERARVGIIKNADLEKVVSVNAELGLEIIKALSKRLQFAQQKIKILALNDITARVAETLLWQARESGIRTPEGHIRLGIKLSRQDLADMIGSTRETVTRILSAFRRDGLIKLEGRGLIITRSEGLKRYIR